MPKINPYYKSPAGRLAKQGMRFSKPKPSKIKNIGDALVKFKKPIKPSLKPTPLPRKPKPFGPMKPIGPRRRIKYL